MTNTKNVLDDLWEEWDYETPEQHYFEIKRAQVRDSERELSDEDRKNWHARILATLIDYNMKINHPDRFYEIMELLDRTFREHHRSFESPWSKRNSEGSTDGSCSPQEYRWKKHLMVSKEIWDESGFLLDRKDYSNCKADFSKLTEEEKNLQIQKNKENNLDDLWLDWDNESSEQRYYELKRAQTRLPYCPGIQDDDICLIHKANEVLHALSIPTCKGHSFKQIIKELDDFFYNNNPSLKNIDFNLPFSYARSNWPAAAYKEYIWRKLLLKSKHIIEELDFQWRNTTCPPDFIWNVHYGFRKQKKSLLRPFWKNWDRKTVEDKAEAIKIITLLEPGLLLSKQDYDVLFQKENEVNRLVHPEQHRPLRFMTEEEKNKRMRRFIELEKHVNEGLEGSDQILMTPNRSNLCVDQEEDDFSIEKAVQYFRQLLGIKPFPNKQNLN